MQVYDRVIIIHIIPMFFLTGFSKELKELVGLKDSIKRGSVTKPSYLISSNAAMVSMPL